MKSILMISAIMTLTIGYCNAKSNDPTKDTSAQPAIAQLEANPVDPKKLHLKKQEQHWIDELNRVEVPTDPSLLQVNDLAYCRQLKQNIQDKKMTMNDVKSKMDSERIALDKSTNEQTQLRSKIDLQSISEVNAFNELTKGLISQQQQFMITVNQYNIDVKSLNALADEFNSACAEKAYLKSDYDKLPPILKK